MRNALLAAALGIGFAGWGPLEAAPTPKLTAPKVAKPPTLDGKLDDEAWAAASARGGKAVIDLSETGDALAATPRIAYLCHTPEALFIAFVIPTAKKLTADEKEGGEIWNDDEHEFFWQPKKGGPYGHICVNVAGAKFTEIKDGDAPEWKPEKIRAAAGKTATAHVVEVAIPFAAVGGAPAPGTAWRVNLAGHEAEGGAWLSTAATAGSFHDAETFLELVLE
jgi:hypothetical protein